MSSGLGEWEKGIPCMLHGAGAESGGSPSGGGRLGLASVRMSCCPLSAARPCA